MKLDDTLRIYRRYADGYDFVFGALFEPVRRAAVKRVNNRPHQRILEVGVGTGLSLPHHRDDARVVGIDVSREMLAKARQRLPSWGCGASKPSTKPMLSGSHSPTTVSTRWRHSMSPRWSATWRASAPNCAACARPTAIVVVNHFSTKHGPMRAIEKALAPLARHIGFHADVPLEDFPGASGLHASAVQPVNLFGYWTLLDCVNDK
jgi:phosphatidylethanolamine/phosphatidyl-N-methylethanolamine N-methyltransferase